MDERKSEDVFVVAKGWLKSGEEAQRCGDYDEALNQFSQAIHLVLDATDEGRLQRLLVEAYICRGATWGGKGETHKAIKDFTLAVKINPSRDLAYWNRGLAWGHIEEHGKAIADFSKVIEIDPGNADAYLQRGWAWKKQNEPQKAATDFAKVKELKNENRASTNNSPAI